MKIVHEITTKLGACLLCLCCVFGCQSDSLLSVSGTVTFDGEIVQDGAIVFMPADGNGVSAGGAIVEGKYTAQVSPGTMMVQIYGNREPTAAEAAKANPIGGGTMGGMSGSGPQKVQFIPGKFNSATTLRTDIQKTEKALDFVLTSE